MVTNKFVDLFQTNNSVFQHFFRIPQKSGVKFLYSNINLNLYYI